jgi:hypothetical protein
MLFEQSNFLVRIAVLVIVVTFVLAFLGRCKFCILTNSQAN